MIEEVVPGSQPDLNSLSLEAALVINHGSPFMGDGPRPLMPNTVQAGLMSCFPGKPLEGELKGTVS